ncbi:MAG: SsrA-binding protein SmpB [Deltaproteobacteria bacterium]|jgi:SsrA-binding protein|nr:SsrA-binding protein SmpB [Deltaproteobacteria bacterium]
MKANNAPSKSGKESYKLICSNKKAAFEYELGERLEAGLVLAGTEVKSLRLGKANLSDSYAKLSGGELHLIGAHISAYPSAFYGNHDPLRKRKLLLHSKEIKKLTGKITEKGRSLIPLKLYFKNGLAKVEIALARGKKLHDKRRSLKEQDTKREIQRTVREYNR